MLASQLPGIFRALYVYEPVLAPSKHYYQTAG